MAGAAELPPAWTATASPSKRPPQPNRTPLVAGVDPLDASGVGAASCTPLPLPPIQSVTAASRESDYRGWQTVESALARFMLPATYQVIDLGTGFSELFGTFAQGFVEGMGEFAEGLSDALQLTPTPLSLTGLDEALQFDFVLAL